MKKAVTSTEQLTAKEWIQEMGRRGGRARAKRQTPAERQELARLAANARWARTKSPDGAPPTQPTPKLRGKKASTSEKGRKVGITLNSRPQLPLPLSIAAAVLFSLLISFGWPGSAHAAVTSLSLSRGAQEGSMPAKATLSKVVHRKPEPFMPFAHVPEYLLCFVTETLECGHELTVFPQGDPLIARYRRCHECDPGKLIAITGAKKPVRGVQLPSVEKKRA